MPFESSIIGWAGILLPSVKGIVIGRLVPLVWDPGSPAPFNALEDIVNDAETCGADPSGGEEDNDRVASDRAAAAVCSTAGL